MKSESRIEARRICAMFKRLVADVHEGIAHRLSSRNRILRAFSGNLRNALACRHCDRLMTRVRGHAGSMAGCKFFFVILLGSHIAGVGAAGGGDDLPGSTANLSPEAVLAASRLVKSGKVYSLAIETGPDTPAWAWRNYQVLTDRIFIDDKSTFGSNKLQGFDEFVCSWLGIGTQIDGFAHIAADGKHYGGLPSSAVIRPNGAVHYSIHNVQPIVGRGVLLDATQLADTEILPAGYAIDRAAVEKLEARSGLAIKRGDIVIFHTGWLSVAASDAKAFMAGEPGLTTDAAQYLADRGVAAVGADNHSLDVMPEVDPDEFLPVHTELLVKRGVHILENIRTAELARDGAREFLFVLAAPRLVGAVQAPVHPIAIR